MIEASNPLRDPGVTNSETRAMTRRGTITVVVLVLWVLLGPLAVTVGSRAAMGAMCEGPCATPSCAILGPTGGIVAADTSSHDVLAARHLPANSFAGLEHLEHPPRLARSA